MADFSSILQSRNFTFLIGPEKMSFTIHVDAVKGLSDPLYNIMTNGVMQESTDGAASLEDVDPKTFADFMEWAYGMAYQMRDGPKERKTTSELDKLLCKSAVFNCKVCSRHCAVSNSKYSFPLCMACNSEFTDRRLSFCMNINCTYQQEHRCEYEYCDRCDFEKAKPNQPGGFEGSYNRPVYLATATWATFTKWVFGTANMSHTELKAYIQTVTPSSNVSKSLIDHAKLHVFADKYLIAELKDICLHGLHMALLEFEITSSNVDELVELVIYTYDNTCENVAYWTADETALEAEIDAALEAEINATLEAALKTASTTASATVPEAENEKSMLRDMVISFAACNARELLQFEAFRSMLAERGELGVEFAYLMAARRDV